MEKIIILFMSVSVWMNHHVVLLVVVLDNLLMKAGAEVLDNLLMKAGAKVNLQV